MFPSYLEMEKTWFLAISSLKNTVTAIWREKKRIPAIWRPKNVVHNCQEQGKRLCHLFKVRKTGSQKLGVRKKCIPAIWNWKKLVPSYFEPDKHCCSYLEREISGCLLFGDKKMQFSTVRSKEKEYDIFLKSENLVHSNQEHEKYFFQLFRIGKKLVSSYFGLNKYCCIYSEREISGSLLFGDKKMQFTAVRSKEKGYDMYLKSEKLVHSNQEHEKMIPSYLEVEKLVLSYFAPEKQVRSYFEGEKCGSLLFGD